MPERLREMDKTFTYADAVMKNVPMVSSTTTVGLSELNVLSMNRHERRRIAKVNGVVRIVGSMKPFTK